MYKKGCLRGNLFYLLCVDYNFVSRIWLKVGLVDYEEILIHHSLPLLALGQTRILQALFEDVAEG